MQRLFNLASKIDHTHSLKKLKAQLHYSRAQLEGQLLLMWHIGSMPSQPKQQLLLFRSSLIRS